MMRQYRSRGAAERGSPRLERVGDTGGSLAGCGPIWDTKPQVNMSVIAAAGSVRAVVYSCWLAPWITGTELVMALDVINV